MQLVNQPNKLILPFAEAGGKRAIPVDSQIGITAGAASLTDGFPPLTRTNKKAGGIPPSGLDMNGILYMLSAIDRWNNAGAGYTYDATFATDTDVNGYPKGARVLRSDGEGYWLNVADNNTTNPESGGTNWVPDFAAGVAAITLAGSNVTLTPLQFGRPIIVLTGTLSANVNVIVPALQKTWCVINNTTGNFTATIKTPSGTGAVVAQGTSQFIVGDGVNVLSITTNSAEVGKIEWFARNTAPTGYLKANGAAVSRTTYANLFGVIGTTFGAGNGSTTFNLPDLRGEFPRGWDDGRGVDAGRVFGSAQQGTIHAIDSTGDDQIYTAVMTSVSVASNPLLVAQRTGLDYDPNGATNYPNTTSAYSNGDGSGGFFYGVARPRNVALLACIKF